MSESFNDKLRTVVKSGGLVFAGFGIEIAVSFIGKIIIARFLNPAEYGIVSIGGTLLVFTSTLALVGLNTGVGRYLPRYDAPEEKRGVLVSAYQLVVPLGITIGVAVFLGGDWIATRVFNDPAATPIIRAFAIAVPFAALSSLSIGGMQGKQRTFPKVLVENLTVPITRFAGVIGAILLGLRAVGIAWGYVISNVVGSLVAMYYVVKETNLLNRSVEYVPFRRELVVFSLPLLLSSVMRFVFSDVDTLMLGYFVSSADVGVYNVIYPIAKIFGMGATVFSFIFTPVVSELEAEDRFDEINRIYQVITKWILIGTLPAFLVAVLFPTMTITVLFGSDYRAGAFALSILSLGIFTNAVVGNNAAILTAIGRSRFIMYATAVTSVVNFALNLVLIPRYSFLGASIATAVAIGLLNGLYSVELYRTKGIQPFTRSLLQPVGTALLLVGIAYWAVITFFEITLPVLIAFFAAFVLVYGVIILKLGGIEEEELMLVLSFEERFGVDLGPLKTIAERIIDGK